MSQFSSLVPTGLISLPLLKYSYATDPSDATKFSWRHEMSEMLVMFDNYGADRHGRQPSSLMKVLQGAKLLVPSRPPESTIPASDLHADTRASRTI
jgi:hypothetical protein